MHLECRVLYFVSLHGSLLFCPRKGDAPFLLFNLLTKIVQTSGKPQNYERIWTLIRSLCEDHRYVGDPWQNLQAMENSRGPTQNPQQNPRNARQPWREAFLVAGAVVYGKRQWPYSMESGKENRAMVARIPPNLASRKKAETRYSRAHGEIPAVKPESFLLWRCSMSASDCRAVPSFMCMYTPCMQDPDMRIVIQTSYWMPESSNSLPVAGVLCCAKFGYRGHKSLLWS
jgi:hypothetical protein